MQGFDALLPAEMAQKAELVGIQKTRMDRLNLFALAALAGAGGGGLVGAVYWFIYLRPRRSQIDSQ